MYKHHKPNPGMIRFRRFSRARWAAFSSMHREVTIGRLASRVADSSLKKVAVAAMLMASSAPQLMAQSDQEREARTLPAVEVVLDSQLTSLSTAEPAAVITAEQFQQHNIRTLADLVSLLPGVDLRVRGVGDAQADLTLRGGTFDQTLLLLNGVNLTDAQTGHYTLDLPIDITMVERVELLSPAQCMARGIVAFCGAVNIVVCDEYRDRLLADVSLGSHGTARASLLATKALGAWALTTAATYSRSDGYRPNTDYRHGSLFLQAQRHGERADLHLMLGGQLKGYGSHAFYSAAYPDQYDATRTLVGALSSQFRISNFEFRILAYGRLHRDRFELFREGYVDSVPSWYTGHNHHLASLAGASLRATRPLGVGEVVAGVDLRREGIRSNVLGQPDSTLAAPYNRSDARLAATAFGGYALRRGRFTAQAVALGFMPILNFESRNLNYGLATTVDYSIQNSKFIIQYSRTYRLPTFTDLYYQGPNQRSNPDLAPEASTSLELALRKKISIFNFQFSIFRRAGTDIIGWVRPTEDDLWLSMNHTAVDATGLDANFEVRISNFEFRGAYSFCHIDADSRGMIASSAIDHLRHRLGANFEFRISNFEINLGAGYRFRQGQYVEAGQVHDYGGTLLLDAGVDYKFSIFNVHLSVHNLLNTEYRDFGGIIQPGTTLTAGLRMEL